MCTLTVSPQIQPINVNAIKTVHEATQIIKPAETDFEQSMLSIFDNKKFV